MVTLASLLTSAPLLAGYGDISLNDIARTIAMLLIAITVHELAHALVADRLGDDTPRLAGHITLNPFRHMNQLGIMLLLITSFTGSGFVFGFTPVNPQKLRQRTKYGPAIVAAAGPAANLLLAFLIAIPLKHSTTLLLDHPDASSFLFDLFYLNIFLAVFNLIPLPPLDGWTVFSAFLTPRALFDLRELVRMGPYILLVLFVLEPTTHWINNLTNPIIQGIMDQMLRI